MEKHINDQEAYMTPLETRNKIISSLVNKTPEVQRKNSPMFLLNNKEMKDTGKSQFSKILLINIHSLC